MQFKLSKFKIKPEIYLKSQLVPRSKHSVSVTTREVMYV